MVSSQLDEELKYVRERRGRIFRTSLNGVYEVKGGWQRGKCEKLPIRLAPVDTIPLSLIRHSAFMCMIERARSSDANSPSSVPETRLHLHISLFRLLTCSSCESTYNQHNRVRSTGSKWFAIRFPRIRYPGILEPRVFYKSENGMALAIHRFCQGGSSAREGHFIRGAVCDE